VADRARLYEEEANKFRLRAAKMKAAFSQLAAQERSKNTSSTVRAGCLWSRFMAHAKAFDNKPYHAAVAVLTDLAFPEAEARTTANEVAQVWKRRK